MEPDHVDPIQLVEERHMLLTTKWERGFKLISSCFSLETSHFPSRSRALSWVSDAGLQEAIPESSQEC
jgi:hypothetical protein